jgi:hypothetical protein
LGRRGWGYLDIEKQDFDKEGELVRLTFLAIRKDLLGKTKVIKEGLAVLYTKSDMFRLLLDYAEES